MMLPYKTAVYEKWAPLIARLLLAIQFSVGAFFKITMFSGQVSETAAAGVPFPSVAVGLALVLEVVSIICLVIGFKVRKVGFVLALYVALLAVIFYHDWSNLMNFGLFMSHLGLIAALLYVSVYGARSFAVKKDA